MKNKRKCHFFVRRLTSLIVEHTMPDICYHMLDRYLLSMFVLVYNIIHAMYI